MKNNNMQTLTSAKNPYGFWTVNGLRTFGIVPEGIVPFISGPIPICLQQGNPAFGYEHFLKRKEQLTALYKMDVPDLIFNKLLEPGKI